MVSRAVKCSPLEVWTQHSILVVKCFLVDTISAPVGSEVLEIHVGGDAFRVAAHVIILGNSVRRLCAFS